MRVISSRLALVGLAAGVFAAGSALAEPVAIVESARGAPLGLQEFDYLSAGQAIELGPGGALVIDYLRSCVRETIERGTVKIGKEQSTVANGRGGVRAKIDCNHGGRSASSGTKENLSGPGFVPPSRPEGQSQEVGIDRTFYSTSPLFDMGGPGQFVVEPLEPPGNAIKLSISAGELVRGRFYDFATAGKHLDAGGFYCASAHDHSLVFWIDPLARERASPPGGRLIRL